MSLDRFRNRKAGGHMAIIVPTWKVIVTGGFISRFKDLQTITSYAVGNDHCEKLLFVTRDFRNEVWEDTRFLTVATTQTERFLESLDAGAELGKQLMTTPPETWQLPQFLGDAPDEESTIRTEMQAIKGRLELMITRTVVGAGSMQNHEVLKAGPRDCEGLIGITLNAFDLIPTQNGSTQSSPSGYEPISL